MCERKKDSTHGLDFILNVMTLPQAFKRHSDRAHIPSYCCKKSQREKEKGGESDKKRAREKIRSAVTSAVESLRDGARRGTESRRTSY